MKVVVLSLMGLSAWAGEYAVLTNGFRIHAERHEVIGGQTRLHTDSGVVDLDSAQIASFEQEEYVKPPEPAKTAVIEEPAKVESDSGKTPAQLIEEAAERHGLRPEFVKSVASAESAMRVDAVSPKGAIGLMQLMPGTAAELGADPHDPAQNADAGARYLKQLLLKYKDKPDGVRLALAAYNAGPGAVDKYRNIPPYRETQAYVDKVVRKYLNQLD